MTGRLTAILAGLVLGGAVAALAIPEAIGDNMISGQARVVDGDSLVVAGQRVRLYGIDAPELHQACGGTQCGQAAREALQGMVVGGEVVCAARDRDRYGRLVAQCSAAGRDLGSRMVALGWAVDYARYSRGAYADEEAAAKAERLGIWSTRFEMPEDWRRTHGR